MHKILIKKYPEITKTSAIQSIENRSFSFIRNEKYLPLITNIDIGIKVVIITPRDLDIKSNNVIIESVDNVDYAFTMIHNILNKNKKSRKNIIGENCNIHPTAVLDVEGIHIAKSPEGVPVQIKHMGNVVLGNNIDILALSTIQKGVFGSTIIEDNVKIDSHVNIGHNSVIGGNTVIALGAIIGGSCIIGSNCMIGLGAIIRNGITICDNVIIGQGSNVVSNITKSGIYLGSPAKYYKEYNKNWNF